MFEKVILLGNEAIARGAYEAGVKVSAAYPGTPSTEISESIVKYKEIYAEWAPNEKVAMEVAIGASLAGVRSLASMKQVGFNVAADPIYTFSYMGVNAGMVVVVADDPGVYSSQNEQDTRAVCRAAHLPVLEPSDSQEAKDFVKFAYEISEQFDTPVVVRTTTRLSHSQSIVVLGEREEIEDKPYVKNVPKNVMVPANSKLKHPVVNDRDALLAKCGCDFPVNRVEMADRNIGVIATGIAYQYVKEALPNASVLKLGIVNPLPRRIIEDFASRVKKLYIVEELDPIIEEQVKSWGIECIGKEIFPLYGEYSANMIRQAIGGEELELDEPAKVPGRPPVLCPGCPHRSIFSVLSKLKLHGAGDIGCYTLGAAPPLSVIDEFVCMGASISTLHGMEKAKGKEFLKDWVAIIGDSTFLHTGINSLMNMVYNKATGTVIIMDNSTTGMTGHQNHPATGKTLMGDLTYAIDIAGVCRAMGIKNVFTINAFNLKELEETVKEAIVKDEITVIIAQSPCIFLDKTPRKPYKIDADKCKSCGRCLKPGCPAMSKDPEGHVKIDDTMCNGCSLCSQLCKHDAIVKVGE